MSIATKWGFHGSAPVTYFVQNTNVRGPENLFQMKTRLKSVGWTVPISGDGLSAFDNTGADVITQGGSGANGMDNDGAYFVLEDPDSLHWLLFSKQANGGSGGARWIIRSAVDAFTGGAAATLPTSTSQRNVCPDISKQFLFRCQLTGTFMFACDNAAPWGFYAISWSTSNPDEAFAMIPCIQPSDSTDPDPYVYFALNVSTSMSHTDLGDNANPTNFDGMTARALAATPTNDPQNAPCTRPGADPAGTGGLEDMWFDFGGGMVDDPWARLGSATSPFSMIIQQRAGVSSDVNQLITKGTNALMLNCGGNDGVDYNERDYWDLDGTRIFAAHDYALPWPGDLTPLETDRGDAFLLGDPKIAAAPVAPTPGPPTPSALNPDAFNGGIPFTIRA